MMKHLLVIIATAVALCSDGLLHAAEFIPLGTLSGTTASFAYDLSDDGSTVVGRLTNQSLGLSEPFRWTAETGMQRIVPETVDFDQGAAYAISADGSVVVGQLVKEVSGTEYPWDTTDFRWTSNGGFASLEKLAGSVPWLGYNGARGVSPDGNLVVGQSHLSEQGDPPFDEAFLWSEDAGIRGLGYLPTGNEFFSAAYDVTNDGKVIGWADNGEQNAEATLWTPGAGAVGLGDLTGHGYPSFAIRMSNDGNVIAGRSFTGPLGNNTVSDFETFRWTEADGMVGLGTLPGHDYSQPWGISAQGEWIVGYSADHSNNPSEAFIWSKETGMISLFDVASENSELAGDLDGWSLTRANGVSADGRAITGYGTNPAGDTEAWLLRLDAPISDPLLVGDFNADGVIDILDVNLLTGAIQSSSTDPKFEMDGNDSIDAGDLYFLIENTLNTFVGDANLDGEFNSSDLVDVFEAGQYEDGIQGNSGWATGDWNGDAEFNTSDLVTAFQDGGYEQGPRAAVSAVPEPTTMVALLMGAVFLLQPMSISRR